MAVYVIGPSDGPYKIGTAVNPSKRLKEIQTGSPVDLLIHMEGDGGRELESQLHSKFEHLRLRGEWFDLSSIELSEIKFILENSPFVDMTVSTDTFDRSVTITTIRMDEKKLTQSFINQLPILRLDEVEGIFWGWYMVPTCTDCLSKRHLHLLVEQDGKLYRSFGHVDVVGNEELFGEYGLINTGQIFI